MKIGILPIGHLDEAILLTIREGLMRVFRDAICLVVNEKLSLREDAFDKKRRQYKSPEILSEVQGYAVRMKGLDRVLGVMDADIFVHELNFVFGQATCPGKAALISLHRLRPKFYGESPKMELFLERALKEAVHELGHTLGLTHCSRSFCVMYFSNSISDTDVKQSLFCNDCYLHATISINELR